MAGYGRYVLFTNSGNFVHMRNSLLSYYRNIATQAVKPMKEDILLLKPKKPLTSFLLYVASVRSKFQKENPGLKSTDIIKKASVDWSQMDFTQKENFKRKYDENYKIYQQRLQKFEDSLSPEQLELIANAKKVQVKEANIMDRKRKFIMFGKPKKPPNSFLLYLLSKKEGKEPDVTVKEWINTMTLDWKNLSKNEKEKYVSQAIELMIAYRQNLLDWEKDMIRLGHTDIVRRKTLRAHETAEG